MCVQIQEIKNSIMLDKTCWACPEQWDAYYGGKIVGYIRLRWGHMTVECPDVDGELVYSMRADDGMMGIFSSNHEEKLFLDKALTAIAEWINRNRSLPEPPKEEA